MALVGNILIIDDEENIRLGLKKILELEKHTVDLAEDGRQGFDLAFKNDYDVIICDLRMPHMDGEEFLNQMMEIKNYLKVIMLTGHGTIQNAVWSIRTGAYDFFIKPLDTEKIIITIQHALREKILQEENRLLKQKIENKNTQAIGYLIGKSKPMKDILNIVTQVSKSNATVLIEGESGTGKELVARAIHQLSERRNQPLIIVNCASLNPNLLESELFGHEKGAFTGANHTKKGRFELADKGTLFLDEIGEIPLSTQVKLLRVLQEKEFERVGGVQSLKIDVRIIAATNKELYKEVQSGHFREDLFYRLNVVNIKMPPLRDRASDIPLLVEAFIKEYAVLNQKNIEGISEDALDIIKNYRFPGNIRELRNVIEGMVVLAKGSILDTKLLPNFMQKKEMSTLFNMPFGSALELVEKEYILQTLALNENNKSKTAEVLDIGRKTLHRKLEEYTQ